MIELLYALVITCIRVLFVWAPREAIRICRQVRRDGWRNRSTWLDTPQERAAARWADQHRAGSGTCTRCDYRV